MALIPSEEYTRNQRSLTEFVSQFDAVAQGEIHLAIKKKFDDDARTWPDVPYDYTQGRIQGYEDWLASLSEHEQEAQIHASRERYSANYANRLTLAREVVQERGFTPDPDRRRRILDIGTRSRQDRDLGRDR